LVHHRIISAVKRIQFVSNKMYYIVLKGHWYNRIVLNVHAPSEEKSGDSEDRFFKELEQVFDHFPMYHLTILLGDFKVKVGRENIFRLKLGMGVYISMVMMMVLEFKTSPHQKIRLLRAPCFCTETFISKPGPLLMGTLTTRLDTY